MQTNVSPVLIALVSVSSYEVFLVDSEAVGIVKVLL